MNNIQEALNAIEKELYELEMEGESNTLHYWQLMEIQAKLKQYITQL
ncbi:hypothetical protein SECTIM467_182 [Brevibacillus phage SecTim467]|uniref:Uncharacterized protein n=2 Tax=Jenstvirus jenst TaxID=1982225 RepID=A0A0K2CNV0_9CAUD|nr:hypothetical protein AVV11_gp014 [Brevibacillus phage Jenst]ALA07306.1 hypothetical protein JENST_177 [Brevibacillus phage Jenst]ALA07502.1 hypothetical protein SECTIM467_182 [Brevibacillus phage SecTim467]